MTNSSKERHSDLPKQPSVYNLSLILAFGANLFVMIGVSLLFRYSDFIESLGGNEWHLGWIVGISSVGAIFFRIVQGKAVDQLGPEVIWIVSLLGQILAIVWHLFIQDVSNWQIYAARMLFAMSIAGNFGAWLSFISLQAPKNRIAEVIGVVGSSGFLGMGIGPWIGDWIFSQNIDEVQAVRNLFVTSVAMIGCSLLVAIVACACARRNRSRHIARQLTNESIETAEELLRQANAPNDRAAIATLLKYQPGFLLIVGVLMGITIGFPSNFLRPWAKSLSIEQLKVFFITYNAVAFASRMVFRRAPQILGLKNTIMLAWGFMAISMLLYLFVRDSNMLWIPAVSAGLAHSFLFPSVVAACSLSYPTRHRGLATSLILATYDVGVLIGMPAIGLIVTHSPSWGLREYPTTFVSIFFVIIVTAGLFAIFGIRRVDPEHSS